MIKIERPEEAAAAIDPAPNVPAPVIVAVTDSILAVATPAAFLPVTQIFATLPAFKPLAVFNATIVES